MEFEAFITKREIEEWIDTHIEGNYSAEVSDIIIEGQNIKIKFRME